MPLSPRPLLSLYTFLGIRKCSICSLALSHRHSADMHQCSKTAMLSRNHMWFAVRCRGSLFRVPSAHNFFEAEKGKEPKNNSRANASALTGEMVLR